MNNAPKWKHEILRRNPEGASTPGVIYEMPKNMPPEPPYYTYDTEGRLFGIHTKQLIPPSKPEENYTAQLSWSQAASRFFKKPEVRRLATTALAQSIVAKRIVIPAAAEIFVLANDVTGIGVADNIPATAGIALVLGMAVNKRRNPAHPA